MARKNTVSWRDCEVITRKCHQMVEALMSYQKYTLPHDERGKGHFGGDQMVCVAAIELRDRLDKMLRENSN